MTKKINKTRPGSLALQAGEDVNIDVLAFVRMSNKGELNV